LRTRAWLEKSSGVESGVHAGVDEASSRNVRNWMDCVRSRRTPNAHIEAGCGHFIALRMTIAAIQSGERVTLDDAKQRLLADAHPWPRLSGPTVGCLDRTRRCKDRNSAEISIGICRLAAEICHRNG
jgi:hypothetical protein